MATTEEIKQGVYAAVADAFMLSVEQVAANPAVRLREDLGASSMNYYPLIADLEEAFDVEFELHDFQFRARTVDDVVAMVAEALA